MAGESRRARIAQCIEESAGLYYRLTLVVAPAGGGKTAALQDLQARLGVPLINVNLELSRRLLDLTVRQRALQIPRLLGDVVGQGGGEILLMDNTEILFDVNLKQDPLRLLQGLSRNRTVVAAWNGSIENGYMTYAEPGHPEYRKYPLRDFLVVTPEVTA